MIKQKEFGAKLSKFLKKAKIAPNAKYLTAKRAEVVHGIPQRTLLNRSSLQVSHKRFMPSSRLKSGRKKILREEGFGTHYSGKGVCIIKYTLYPHSFIVIL